MEEYRQITLEEWVQWKEDIRRKLSETAGNFVHIGFRLKQIRDSGMFGGAADIFEFASNEYGLSRSTVSRFIAINEKYSEGGNSPELREEFRNFSSSKLSEMLTLPDQEIEMINERTTVKAIRELKKFDAQEPEEEEERAEEEPGERIFTPLEKCVIDFFKDKKDVLNQIMGILDEEDPDYKQAAELMAPSGQAFHKKGIVFIFFYGFQDGVKYKLMTSPEPVHMDYPEFLNMVHVIYNRCAHGNWWEEFYGSQNGGKPDKDSVGEPVAAPQQTGEEKTEQQAGKEPEKQGPKTLEPAEIPGKAPIEAGKEEPVKEEAGKEPEKQGPKTLEPAEIPSEAPIEAPDGETGEESEGKTLEPAEIPGAAGFREERIKEATDKLFLEIKTIQTDMSFAGRDTRKWMNIKLSLQGAAGMVQDLIKYIGMGF